MHRLLALCGLALLVGCDDLPPRLALGDASAVRDPDIGDIPDERLDGRTRFDGAPPDAEVGDDGRPGDGGGRDLAELDAEPTLDLAVDGGADIGEPVDGEVFDVEPFDGDRPDLGLPDFELPDLELPDLDVPDLAPPDLDVPDLFVPPPELCNGLDDDGNGIIDDAPVCGRVIANQCRVFLGLQDFYFANIPDADGYGGCPGSDSFSNLSGSQQCVGTRGGGAFRRLEVRDTDTVNNDNHLVVALLCDRPGAGAVAAWVEQNCRVYLGQGENGAGRGAEARDAWGPCPGASGVDGDYRCTSTGGDARFHALHLNGNVNENDSLAVAWRCDGVDGARGAQMTTSVAVAFAWTNANGVGGADESLAWTPDCPGPDGDGNVWAQNLSCTTSAFDGRFHHIEITEQVGGDDAFGIALIPRPDAPPP